MSEMYKSIPVFGYKSQSQDNINIVNTNKELEERLLRQIDNLANCDNYDKRMLALAKTQIEQGCMWLNRAIFRPHRIDLPEDDIRKASLKEIKEMKSKGDLYNKD